MNKKEEFDALPIAEKIKRIVVDHLGVAESEVTPEASFRNDLGADSLDEADLVMKMEKEFNLFIPEEEAKKIRTVGEAIDFIERMCPSEREEEKEKEGTYYVERTVKARVCIRVNAKNRKEALEKSRSPEYEKAWMKCITAFNERDAIWDLFEDEDAYTETVTKI